MLCDISTQHSFADRRTAASSWKTILILYFSPSKNKDPIGIRSFQPSNHKKIIIISLLKKLHIYIYKIVYLPTYTIHAYTLTKSMLSFINFDTDIMPLLTF